MSQIIGFKYNDGGRKAAGFKGSASDCVARAISIASGIPYKEVYDEINRRAKSERREDKSSARTGVHNRLWRKYCEDLGMTWVPTMGIGTGCTTHVRADELPNGRLILSVSKHVVACIDGVLHDTHNCSRAGKRCVYGYFICHKNNFHLKPS
jgi:hypothetical protein